jgi:hypothetical protein
VQRNGRTTVVGYYNRGATGGVQLAVLRYLPNGQLDRSFARKGFSPTTSAAKAPSPQRSPCPMGG